MLGKKKGIGAIYKFILNFIEDEFNEDLRMLKMEIINEHIRDDGSWQYFTLPTSLKKRIGGKQRLKLRGLLEFQTKIVEDKLPF